MNELLFLKIMVLIQWAGLIFLLILRIKAKFNIKTESLKTESIEINGFIIGIENGNLSIKPKAK